LFEFENFKLLNTNTLYLLDGIFETMIQDYGKLAIVAGVVLIIVGSLLVFWGKIPFIGKLPGDLLIKKGNFTIFIPLASSIVISILFSLLLTVLFKYKGDN